MKKFIWTLTAILFAAFSLGVYVTSENLIFLAFGIIFSIAATLSNAKKGS